MTTQNIEILSQVRIICSDCGEEHLLSPSITECSPYYFCQGDKRLLKTGDEVLF